MHILNKKIIGIVTIITLIFIQINPTYAFYSPILNQKASKIRQHISTSKQKNGIGTWWNVAQKAEKSQKIKLNKGYQNIFKSSVKEIAIWYGKTFLDGLSLIVKTWLSNEKGGITNCLRDDIWEAQALQEEVLNEVMKASILSNAEDSSILWSDFNSLEVLIRGKAGLKNNFKDSSWFPQSQNFYTNCPYGDFKQAWEDFERALESFKSIGSGSIELGNFGALDKVAKRRAITRAQKWIKSNQITMTIGGKEGSSPRSLLNGPGLAGLAADIKTEMQYAASFGELVFVNTYNAFSGFGDLKNVTKLLDITTYADNYTQSFKARDKAVRQMESAIKFNLTLNNVANNSLKEIDKIMFETNGIIEDAFSLKTIPENARSLCEKIASILKKQCKGKISDIPTCK